MKYAFSYFPTRIPIDVACNTDTMHSNTNVPTPNALENMSALDANVHDFSIRSNVCRIVIVPLAICCQPTSLFLTTSQAEGIPMIPPLVSNGLESTFGHLYRNTRNLRGPSAEMCPR